MPKTMCLIACGIVLALSGGARAAEDAWPAVAPGFEEPKPGEHPRLFFRKSDVPALRIKMQMPQGQRMVKRLRELLGNDGEELPRFEKIIPLNLTMDRTREGHFTIGHPAGYGMLY